MLLRKVDGFFGPFSTWTVQNSLDNLDVHLPPMQGCLQPLIASTTITIALVHTVLTSGQRFSQASSKEEL